MGCSSCGTASPSPRIAQQNKVSVIDVFSPDCPYTSSMLEGFRDALIWFKDRGLHIKHNITSKTMNSHIGIVLSSLNFNNRCRYESQLDQISDLVNLIVAIQNE